MIYGVILELGLGMKKQELSREPLMTLSTQVSESLRDAQSDLRNALAYAARNEEPWMVKHIATALADIDNLFHVENLLNHAEEVIKDMEE